jgi:hypothetical protein
MVLPVKQENFALRSVQLLAESSAELYCGKSSTDDEECSPIYCCQPPPSER